MWDFGKNRLSIIVLAIAPILCGAVAKADVSLTDMQRLNLNIEKVRLADFRSNPASMFYRDSVSLSSFGIDVDLSSSDKPCMEQLGSGYTLVKIGADSYMRLDKQSVVWGTAQFTTGSYRDIKWNDCLDYLRIAPYVLGDEVGGNLSTRQYTFSGGYARKFGKYTVGAYADYRAEIAYRNRDPRVKTIVSDLNLNFGASYRFTPKYMLGVNAGINVYNQSCDLDFYNPLNEINTYTLTGMGTYYKRFMGNTNKNSGYTSIGYRAGVQLLPLNGSAVSAGFDYNRYRMNQQLRSFNNITLGYTDNDYISGFVAFRNKISSKLIFQPRVSGGFFTRKGTENLFGSSAGASYEKIGSRAPYSLKTAVGSVSLPLQISLGKSMFTISPTLDYDYLKEKYSEPFREISFTQLSPGINLQLSLPKGESWLWDMEVSGKYGCVYDKKYVMTDLDSSTSLGVSVNQNYSMMSADKMWCGINLGVSHRISKVIFKLSACYNVLEYRRMSVIVHQGGFALSAYF